MRKLILVSLIFLFSVTNMTAQVSNNKYEDEWKKVELAEQENLPQSAIETIDIILQKAMNDKNITQVIKALIHKNEYKKKIDYNDNEGLIYELQELLPNIESTAEKSLVHSMLAELYGDLYRNNMWQINQRTKLIDVVPEDMKEWSSNIFTDKVIENLNLSIKEVETLKKHTTKEYDDIIEIGADGQTYYPTLYDFLMNRVLTLSASNLNWNWSTVEFNPESLGLSIDKLAVPADEYVKLNIPLDENNRSITYVYYQQYLKDLLQRNLIPTVILTDIERIKSLSNNSGSFRYKVLDAYKTLYDKYNGYKESVEIIDNITDSYYIDNDQSEKKSRNAFLYEWLQKGIEKYPDYNGTKILLKKRQSLEASEMEISGKYMFHPEESVQLDISHKNMQAVEGETSLSLYRKDKDKYLPIKKYPLHLVSKAVYDKDKQSLDLGRLAHGRYCLTSLNESELREESPNERFDFIVSSFAAYSRNQAKNEYEIFVVDRISGKPIENASITLYPSKNRTNNNEKDTVFATLKTNSLGLAFYKDNRPFDKSNRYSSIAYNVELKSDTCFKAGLYKDYRWNYGEDDDVIATFNSGVYDKEQPYTNIFTDRSIYRPGQTIHFKAIATSGKNKLATDKSYTVKLYNPNGEVTEEKDIITNEFGSISGSFTIPQNGLLGNYGIEIQNGYTSIRVEEYKRPTFEITFDKVDKTYTFGEEVKLKGYAKNFSGINLQDADVRYIITREQYRFWWRSGNASHFAEGVVKTNVDGSFEISFTPEAGDKRDGLFRMTDNGLYSFNITAIVTDVNGETQSNSHQLTVGNISMLINIDVPEQMEKNEKYKFDITARNLQEQDIDVSGLYELYKLDDKDSIQNKVSDGTFKTGAQDELISKFKTLVSGKYQLKVKALDDKGNEISEKKDFILYSYSDKKPPIKTSEWLVRKNTIFDKNKPVEVIYGTTDKEAYVLYQLSNNKEVFERKIVKINNANQLFSAPYKNEYGEEIIMSFTSIRNGKLYSQSINLTKAVEETNLDLNTKLEVFRDKLRPGQNETWTISVKDTTNTPALAEILASMYDTSLDKINPYFKWSFIRPYNRKEYIYPVVFTYAFRGEEYNKNFIYESNKEESLLTPFIFDNINWFGYLTNEMIVTGVSRKVTRLTSMNDMSLEERNRPMANVANLLGGRVAGVITTQKSEQNMSEFWVRGIGTLGANEDAMIGEMSDGGNNSPAPQIRQNFNETAFFFPQLRTNEKGETLITFTVPESNTTWRFRALAHDKDTRTGTLEQLVVTRKDLMITPNIPRFIRQGDKIGISTKISNLSENPISGDVRIEFFDPVTDKIVDLNIADQKQTFSIGKDASTSVDWTFDVPNDIELLGCRIVAQNETFSDGEQHVLAVLSNRMLVTESMPINVTKAGVSTFTFDKLYNNKSATSDHYKLTLEYASNPAWYAIQALPTMSNPSNENAVAWFASYYVNTLGSSIVRQYPKVSAMIQAWLKQGGDKETLISKLQKDESLKTVLLEETPWVLDAKNETEQMQRLSLLFDLNNTKQLTDAATGKLQELLNNDGGWSWYKGFYPSRSITQYILYGYAKLQQVGQVEYPQEIKEMQMNALKSIDKQILKDFETLKKDNKDWKNINYVSGSHIEYAYVRSFYRDIPIDKETREAERFYTDIASKNWTKLSLYQQAILSITLKRNGDTELASKIAKSIKEHAVNDKKQGMYWPNNRGNIFISMSSISAHTFLMDALLENGATQQDMNAMKRWLLSQKQTQIWESTHATIDAINALLSTGSDWFTTESTATAIKVGDNKVEPNKELGTGYFKNTWTKPEIKNNMAKVEVTTPSADPAFGALYWQYYENLDKITAQQGDLNVEKQLFKETVSSTGKGLVQVTESNPLTVGDKVVVRLTVRTDKDMEFVHLKDMRASCFEPEQTISGTKWTNGLIYYQMPKDASTNFYFDRIPKGTYVLEYPVYVSREGEYSNGITTIQCMYAPQFVSHTQGIKVTVNRK